VQELSRNLRSNREESKKKKLTLEQEEHRTSVVVL